MWSLSLVVCGALIGDPGQPMECATINRSFVSAARCNDGLVQTLAEPGRVILTLVGGCSPAPSDPGKPG